VRSNRGTQQFPWEILIFWNSVLIFIDVTQKGSSIKAGKEGADDASTQVIEFRCNTEAFV
jgi:hypothetical protein